MNAKKHDVFISFAEPDRKLAEELRALLSATKLSSYFAPKNLPKDTPQEWQRAILDKGLRQSRAFVPLFSRQSLSRRWVLFEAGAAAALGLKFFIARVDGIDEREITDFPYTHHLYHYKLFSEEDLRNLVMNLLKEKHGSQEITEAQAKSVDTVFADRKQLVQAVLCRARRRWVFIAGNRPNDPKGAMLQPRQLSVFARKLTLKLLEAGFNVSACPQVKGVGMVVLQTAQKHIAQNPVCAITGCAMDYEIAGIFPVDRDVRSAPLGDDHIRARWMEHVLQFRKGYLAGKDWLLLVGGNEGTREEFQAAEVLNSEESQGLRTCFVPCFGGTAMKLNRRRGSLGNPDLCHNGCAGLRSGFSLDALVDNVVKVLTETRTK